MNSINVKNGLELQQFDNYTLYEMFTEDAKKYYMCLPTSNQEEYQMVFDFSEEYYNSLLESEKISEISKICDLLYTTHFNSIYVLSNITTYDLHEAKEENDSHAYRNLLKKMHEYTYAAYTALDDNKDLRINQTIYIINQTPDDVKLMDWLDLRMPGYFKGIDFRHLLSDTLSTESSGGSALSGPNNGTSIEQTNNKSNHKVKILVPNKHGFLNITFIAVIIVLSFIIGIGMAYLLIK